MVASEKDSREYNIVWISFDIKIKNMLFFSLISTYYISCSLYYANMYTMLISTSTILKEYATENKAYLEGNCIKVLLEGFHSQA